MLAWYSQKEISFFVSKNGIDTCSNETEYWIKGFLVGKEPESKRNENGDVDFKSADYKKWLKKIEQFRQTGIWED